MFFTALQQRQCKDQRRFTVDRQKLAASANNNFLLITTIHNEFNLRHTEGVSVQHCQVAIDECASIPHSRDALQRLPESVGHTCYISWQWKSSKGSSLHTSGVAGEVS